MTRRCFGERMPWLWALVPLVTAAALAVAMFGPSGAVAQCSGSSCLPGSGYTFDNYYCGVTFGPGGYCSDSSTHSYGFNSADYDGSGATTVCTLVETLGGADRFSSCSTNLDRSCYYSSCNDQDGENNLVAFVDVPFERHTIYGHAKA